jgi:hypothetical protein
MAAGKGVLQLHNYDPSIIKDFAKFENQHGGW